MIQRIQSVFLLIASLCLGGLYLLPFGGSKLPVEATAFSDSLLQVNDYMILQVAVPVGIGAFLVSIFLFSNRKIQTLVSLLGSIAIGIIVGFVAMSIYNAFNTFSGDNSFLWKPGIGLPVVALVFALLANRAIKKDDKLVKSMDRLR